MLRAHPACALRLTVPRILVHRYWSGPTEPGAASARNLEALRSYHGRLSVQDWTDATLPAEVRELADGLADRAMPEPRQALRHRANVVRYALLRRFGGWWADHDLTPLRPFHTLPTPATAGHGTRCTCWLAFPADHPRLTEALQAIAGLGPGDRPSVVASGELLLDRLAWPDSEVARVQLPHDGLGRPIAGAEPWAVHAYQGGR